MRAKGTPKIADLMTLYDSDGITPDYLKELGVISEYPSDFYDRITALHSADIEKNIRAGLSLGHALEQFPETELLFYKDDPKEFDAKVLRFLDDKYAVLDKTSFYPRGGGQEPDHGTIAGLEVDDVFKHGDAVVHKLSGGTLKEGQTVKCVVDSKRREGITKHHTSTHILNSSSRTILGSWVWQHSAFKEVDHARLDITHHSALTDDEVRKIEELANAKVKENIPVTIQNFDRGTAEQKYGFRIYQGGVVPVKSVRIVSIADFDVEACGGTHTKTTKEVELIKIKRAKRIQDGVVRLEFVAGDAAREYVKQHAADLEKQSAEQTAKEARDRLRDIKKAEDRLKIPMLLEEISQCSIGTTKLSDIEVITTESRRFCWTKSDRYDEYFHINFGEKLIKNDPKAVYCGIFEEAGTIRAIIHAGEQAPKKADDIAKAMAEILGGSGGGYARFAQGGGPDKSKKDEAINKAKSMVGV
ncbi:MAG: hypothetical protein NPMRTH5_1150002 [Nitrosopumilales archaeon]|nr:MAG: hypothetical protein NPMRTH5_1150002 [Nitrosopumilales archaeon]